MFFVCVSFPHIVLCAGNLHFYDFDKWKLLSRMGRWFSKVQIFSVCHLILFSVVNILQLLLYYFTSWGVTLRNSISALKEVWLPSRLQDNSWRWLALHALFRSLQFVNGNHSMEWINKWYMENFGSQCSFSLRLTPYSCPDGMHSFAVFRGVS